MDIKAYACMNQNLDERIRSSSGGIFALFAKIILSKQGAVYGVTMAEDLKSAEFIRIIDKSNVEKLYGSKYIQAHIGDTFIKVKKDLDNEIIVLFSGTACQVNGLKSFLGKEYDNLYCVDVVCHGTPSPELWKRYVKYIEEENGKKLVDIKFRCKDINYYKQENEENKRYIFSLKNSNPYMLMFLRDYSLRPSCYKCNAKTKKKSDVTLADFWGIDKIKANMNDEKGTSLVMIRTRKGESIFNKIKEEIKVKQVSYLDSIKYNVAEYKSVDKPIERDCFFNDMNLMNFEMLAKKYAKPYLPKLKNRIKKLIKKYIFLNNSEKVNWSNYGLLFVLGTMKEKELNNSSD